jgi:uncharacterized protein
MDKAEIINVTINHVKNKFKNEATGHDWYHIERVYNVALHIAKQEKADVFIVQLGALLHDIADHKFHGGDETIGTKTATDWLNNFSIEETTKQKIISIVEEISFKGANVKTPMTSLEGKIVQDADRLDALGAIGIARCFAYSGSKGRQIYDPKKPYTLHNSFDAYKNDNGSAINHFYEKLLLLKNLINTDTGKKIADQRHAFMESYLKEFYDEWNFITS